MRRNSTFEMPRKIIIFMNLNQFLYNKKMFFIVALTKSKAVG